MYMLNEVSSGQFYKLACKWESTGKVMQYDKCQCKCTNIKKNLFSLQPQITNIFIFKLGSDRAEEKSDYLPLPAKCRFYTNQVVTMCVNQFSDFQPETDFYDLLWTAYAHKEGKCALVH